MCLRALIGETAGYRGIHLFSLTVSLRTSFMIFSAVFPQSEVSGCSHTRSRPHSLVITLEDKGHDRLATSPASVSGQEKLSPLNTVSL